MKTAECQVAFRGHDYVDVLIVQSPTGRRVELDCHSCWKKMSPQLLELALGLRDADYKTHPWGQLRPATVSYEVMSEVRRLSRAAR